MGAVRFVNRLLGASSDVGEYFGEPLMCGRVARIDGEGLAELGLASGKIPVVEHLHETDVGVGARQRGIKLESFLSGRNRLGDDFVGIAAEVSEHGVDIGQSSIGEGIGRVFVDRLIEIGDGGVEIGVGALVPGISTFYVELVGVRVLCALVGDLLFFFAAEFGPQLVCDIACDLLLQGNNVRCFAFVLAAPDFSVVLDVGEVGGDLYSIAVLRYAAGEQGVDGQVLANLLRINVLAFVAENGVAGFHLQIGKMREAGY